MNSKLIMALVALVACTQLEAGRNSRKQQALARAQERAEHLRELQAAAAAQARALDRAQRLQAALQAGQADRAFDLTRMATVAKDKAVSFVVEHKKQVAGSLATAVVAYAIFKNRKSIRQSCTLL